MSQLVGVAAGLAPWASHPGRSRGRRHPEQPPPGRTEHQRDRDRVVHSTAFRRLTYKTQVFVNHEGDLFRTRLTHSLEVAQLSRSVARMLCLNEDLVEAIALAHDLGHTPFGHAGQDALHACMAEHGGFEHNLQSLRVVDHLEHRYPSFDGLNLSFETREGILKHCSRRRAERLEAAEPGGVGRRFLDGTQPSLEAQVVNLADEIAYNAHDIDDGVRSGLLDAQQLTGLAAYGRIHHEVLAEHPGLAGRGRRLLFEVLRRMLSQQVHDLVAHTDQAVRGAAPADADEVRRRPPLAALPEGPRAEFIELKRFLFASLYRHPQVVHTTAQARRVVAELFEAYRAAPQEMPADFAEHPDRPRATADYIAGMTDRFALREYHRLTGRSPFPAALQPGGWVAGG
ncbi:MAG: putative deoxyguanosinetriphosphate triphosphohydrolase Dgt [Pseudomonadota bacterium]